MLKLFKNRTEVFRVLIYTDTKGPHKAKWKRQMLSNLNYRVSPKRRPLSKSIEQSNYFKLFYFTVITWLPSNLFHVSKIGLFFGKPRIRYKGLEKNLWIHYNSFSKGINALCEGWHQSRPWISFPKSKSFLPITPAFNLRGAVFNHIWATTLVREAAVKK